MNRIALILIIFLLTKGAVGQEINTDSLINSAKIHLSGMKYSLAFKDLKLIEEKDSMQVDVLRMKAESYMVLGMPACFKYMEKLKQAGDHEYLEILTLKEMIFTGMTGYEEAYMGLLEKYPDHPEMDLCGWLIRLMKGDTDYCRGAANELSNRILFGFAPYLALYYQAWDEDYQLALQYLDTLESLNGKFYETKMRDVLHLMANNERDASEVQYAELPYADCGGVGMGFYLIDQKGDSVKIEVDTGTGYGLMTVHDQEVGQRIAGEEVFVIENGIQYNYMDGPRDLHYKKASLKAPAMESLIFGYFDGKFSKADGCTSPFVFRDLAIRMDPIQKKVSLETRETLAAYVRENRDRLEIVPYQVRNSWLYIPCRVNGKEVMMMVETGSRDINLNEFSIRQLGVQPYEGSLMWNNQEYKMPMVDFTVEIGKIKYEVKGGLVSDFVLGNLNYGLASAGDIGPDFMRNYAFTIDPFHQTLIFELPKETL